ncbi:hypothetical protein D4764_0277530 [Takifugu flavidus]|uniref:Uncharacterized protein n=1 Tax=Takifugu flavidus TaxID=433684 RepID=A0A5C6MM73_9TELE|nr:hypothetical protein D4764_0277530 [Takifugu flavidus]
MARLAMVFIPDNQPGQDKLHRSLLSLCPSNSPLYLPLLISLPCTLSLCQVVLLRFHAIHSSTYLPDVLLLNLFAPDLPAPSVSR